MENQRLETPGGEETEQKEIKTIEKNGKYEVKFLTTNLKLYIQCIDKEFPYPTNENKYDLKQLVNAHRYFLLYEDMSDLCSFLKSIEENSIKLEERNESIILKIKCNYKEKLTDVDLELPFKKPDYDKIIKDLFN